MAHGGPDSEAALRPEVRMQDRAADTCGRDPHERSARIDQLGVGDVIVGESLDVLERDGFHGRQDASGGNERL